MSDKEKISDYIRSYLYESKAQADIMSNPSWLRAFFSTFHRELEARSTNISPGNRRYVASTVAKSLKAILPPDVGLREEVFLREFLSFESEGSLSNLLNKKLVDFVLKRGGKSLLIEFKTNIQFNDLAAAMTEMAAVKKFATGHAAKGIITGSLHLFPGTQNVDGLRELNMSLGSPLNYIWVLCSSGREVKFDIEAINRFRDQVSQCLF